MKKTTKILLVLAAVVAMTIGAVSTVMAADEFQTIGAWSYDSNANTYSATDINGEQIVRGWAQENGRWYFFDSAIMLTNAFVTWKDDVYFLDGEGCMAVGWIGFTDETKIKCVDKGVTEYDNITEAFDYADVDDAGRALFTEVFADDKTYETMWCYFDEHGVMANHEWIEAWGLHYFIYGPYCVMDNYSVQIRLNGDDDLSDAGEGIYGFSGYGNMHVNWIPVDYEAEAKKNGIDVGTPFEQGGKDAKTAQNWTYYHADGKQVNDGWEKIDGKWCYFIADASLGMLLVKNTLITDATVDNGSKYTNGATMYVDADGYMVTGTKTFAADTTTAKLLDDGDISDEDWTTMKVNENDTATFYFDTETGAMKYGIIGNYYYNNIPGGDEVFVVAKEDVVTGTAIKIDAVLIGEEAGERVLATNFFLHTKDKDNKDVYYYFEYGKMIKNEAIKFGDMIVAINADGLVKTENAGTEITIDGIKYKFTDSYKVTLGNKEFNTLVKK